MHFISTFTGDKPRLTFGADIESLESKRSNHRRLHHSVSMGNDATSVQMMGHYSHLDAASVVSRGHSLPTRPPLRRSDSASVDSGSKSGGIAGIRFPQNLFAGDNNGRGNCKHCAKLEADLAASREDLEYLRGMALRNEYTCATCQTEPSKGMQTPQTVSIHANSSEVVNDMSEKHKAEVQNLIMERVSLL